jgi:predicted RNase H-like HicB family nuclease
VYNSILEAGMSEIVFIVEDAPEGGYTARALGNSIYTEGDTWDDLKSAIQDALACHFESEQKPRIVRLHYLREEVMAV